MIENRALSGGSHLLRVRYDDARAESPRAQPGQFVMLLRHPSRHLVRRPMSIHDEGDGWRTFMVKPVGPASTELVETPEGGQLDVSAPLGRGFGAVGEGPLLLVGGGFGVAPLHFLARRLDALPQPRDYRILYGGRTRRDVELDVLDGIRGEVLPSTEDGLLGFRGTCVALATKVLDDLGDASTAATILTCGSHAMMRALFDAVGDRVAVVYVSLEEIMACGVGVCMGCVTPSRHGNVPICTHGPVFRADEVFGANAGVERVEI